MRQVLVRRRGFFTYRPPGKKEDTCPIALLNISVQAEAFIRREKESRRKRSEGGAVDVQVVSLLVLMWVFMVLVLVLEMAT